MYKDSAKTQLVAQGTASTAGTLTLTAQNGSGLSGTVDVTGIGEDIDSGNTLTGTANTHRITTLPSGSFTVVNAADDTDLNTTGASGTVTARLKKGGVTIVDASIDLSTDRDWSSVSADAAGNKVVVHFPSDQIAAHGHDASSTPHTIYSPVGSTIRFRVCPEATTLEQVHVSCGGGVLFQGPFPQEQSVGTDTVEVGTVSIGGVMYWYASGLTGSGGEGEDGGETPVPFFPWWAYPPIVLVGLWFLQREGFLARG